MAFRSLKTETSLPRSTKYVAPPQAESKESKSSMLCRLKQQAQGTGGFFKKHQQSFAEKLQKGLRLASGLTTAQKKDCSPEDSQDIPVALNINETATCSIEEDGQLAQNDGAGLVAALEQMGFDSVQVMDALAMLGGQPEDMDDVLQVLRAMDENRQVAAEKASEELSLSTATLSTSEDSNLLQEDLVLKTVDPGEPKQESSPVPPSHLLPMPSRSCCGSAEFEAAMAKVRPVVRPRVDAEVVQALQRMGFSQAYICEASMLHASGASFEDLFETLLTMTGPAAASLGAQVSSTAFSSCTLSEKEGPCAIKSEGMAAEERNADAVGCDQSPRDLEPSMQQVAAIVVASVLSKVAIAATATQEEAAALKHMLKGSPRTSPVVGGA
jgi:hypothetical protein